ncbi:hypothetical protein AGMMS49579_19070 [Spirochaetia bacterium]|nr:hypothetical protein AGMMS49579_19040 [Spirochaetia bacterium]GHV55669.1 hypothetical protein AGMMS49579_19070 [Spirochaetia bacterium]
MKIPIIAGIVLACSLVFTGCVSGSRATALKVPAQGPQAGEKRPQSFQIIDYQTRTAGADIPEWVNRYLAESARGVEKLAEFEDKYIFVGKGEGVNFNALRQWEMAFSPAQDFPRLVASRIEARIIGAAQNAILDDTYGPFFEALIKEASDAQYQGAVMETSFWVKLLFSPDEAGAENEENEESERIGVNREVYDFLILISIDKNQLESQIIAIFDAARESIPTNPKPRRDQTAAINRLRQYFFIGF